MTFLSSVDDNEVENLIKLLGMKNKQGIDILKRLQVQVKLYGKFDIFLGKRGQQKFTYKAKNPFLPYLYYNGISSRICVSPLRTWVDPICQVCDSPTTTPETDFNLEQFMKDFKTKFGDKHNAKQIVRIKLYQQGINCYPKKIAQGLKYIDKFLSQKLLSLDDLRKEFELEEETNTRLSKSKSPEIKDEQVDS